MAGFGLGAEGVRLWNGGLDTDGIYLVGVGVGTASTYNDALMDTLTSSRS